MILCVILLKTNKFTTMLEDLAFHQLRHTAKLQ